MKIVSDLVVISDYDGGYRFSIFVNGKYYTREDIELLPNDHPFNLLFKASYCYEYSKLKDLFDEVFKYKTLIYCSSGDIEIFGGKHGEKKKSCK